MNNIVIYHRDCYDGTTSAWLMKLALADDNTLYVPCAYDEREKIVCELTDKLREDTKVWIVDFSLDLNELSIISKYTKNITVIDHHNSFEKKIPYIKEYLPHVNIIFDKSCCGASIVWSMMEHSNNNFVETYYNTINNFIGYINDGDMWESNMEESKAIITFLRSKIEVNNINSVQKYISDYHRYLDDLDEFDEAVEKGKMLLDFKMAQVNEIVDKMVSVSFDGYAFKAVNTNIHVSDVGNLGAERYLEPTLMFGYDLSKNLIWCSLRSIKELGSINHVAEGVEGGGGHELACGFTLSPEEFHKRFKVLE